MIQQANVAQLLAATPTEHVDKLLKMLSEEAEAPHPRMRAQEGLTEYKPTIHRKATSRAPGRLRGMNQFSGPLDALR